MHTGNIPPVNELITQRKRKRGGSVKTKTLVANPIEKSVVDKNTILKYVTCGHFALSTLSETCFQDAVFEVNVRQSNYTGVDPKHQLIASAVWS